MNGKAKGQPAISLDQGRKTRGTKSKSTAESFLIVCEGKKTEPFYFRGFSNKPTASGDGRSTKGVVEQAIKLRKKGFFDQVWCVFDRDSFSKNNFNAALSKAKAHGIKVAYSNEAFEIWYLLHFNYYETGFSRKGYEKMLSKLLQDLTGDETFKYKKNSQEMYELLKPLQEAALLNAKRLHDSHTPHCEADDNPCTLVYQLVDLLNQNERP